MPKYVTITNHLSVDELASRYRKAVDPIERSHFQIVWLLAQGKRVRESWRSQVTVPTGFGYWPAATTRMDHRPSLINGIKTQAQHPCFLKDCKATSGKCLSKRLLMADSGQAGKSRSG